MTRTVLISINSSWNIFNFRSGLIRSLRSHGYRVITAAPRDAYSDRLAALVDAHYDLSMDNGGTNPLRDGALTGSYISLLRHLKPDVLLTYTIKPNIYGTFAAKLCGVPVIANVSGLGTAFIRTNWLTRLVKLLYRAAFRNASYVFFQNAHDRDLFVANKLVAAEKAGLLPGSGIDLTYFHPSHNTAPNGPLGFVLIARLLWDKGIGEYVEAARRVKAQHPDAQFHIVGARGVKNKTAIDDGAIAQWASEGVVAYLGETDDIRSVIALHDCVVLPSYREGMSRVLLEAAAMGKPLIASDVPGCADVVGNNVNGLLCTPRDANALADAMLQFIALSPAERTAMGAASRAKAESEFDEQRVFDAYLERIATLVTQ